MSLHVIIAGTRSFNNFEVLCEKCDNLLQRYAVSDLCIVSGGATGADTLGEWYSYKRGIVVQKMPADWGKHGRSAGMLRNWEMAKLADAAIVFWDGESRGAKHMIDAMQGLDKPVRVIRYQDQEL